MSPTLDHPTTACYLSTTAPTDDQSLFSHVPPPAYQKPTLGRTQNFGITFTQSGSACLDLFFDTTPGIQREALERSLSSSWNEVRSYFHCF